MENLTEDRMQAIISRAYVSDPTATRADLRALAGEQGELKWLYMLGQAEKDAAVEAARKDPLPGITKVSLPRLEF